MLSLNLLSNLPLAIDLERGLIQKSNFKFERHYFSSYTIKLDAIHKVDSEMKDLLDKFKKNLTRSKIWLDRMVKCYA